MSLNNIKKKKKVERDRTSVGMWRIYLQMFVDHSSVEKAHDAKLFRSAIQMSAASTTVQLLAASFEPKVASMHNMIRAALEPAKHESPDAVIRIVAATRLKLRKCRALLDVAILHWTPPLAAALASHLLLQIAKCASVTLRELIDMPVLRDMPTPLPMRIRRNKPFTLSNMCLSAFRAMLDSVEQSWSANVEIEDGEDVDDERYVDVTTRVNAWHPFCVNLMAILLVRTGSV